MTEEQAQKIVYAFVDVLCEGAPIVCDADRLPYPKETIRQAFDIHIRGYDDLERISSELFKKKGYDKDLSDLRAIRVRLDDFKTIEPEDKPAIERLKTGSLSPEDTVRVIVKYRST